MWQMLLMLLIPAVVFAKEPLNALMDAQSLPELKQTLAELREKTNLPVIFPQKIPVLPKEASYYIYVTAEPGNSRYMISIDKTQECHGKHNCMIGNLMAVKGQIPQVYYSMENQEITVPVELAGGKKGYFTPSHAMADFWSPQIEWRDGNVLYRLSWNLVAHAPEKEMLVNMANSVIKY